MPEPGRLQLLGLAHWRSTAQSIPLPDGIPGYLLGYLAYRGDWVGRMASSSCARRSGATHDP